MPGLPRPFTGTSDGRVIATLPAPLIGLLEAVVRGETDEHPLAALHGGPLAVVPDADGDVFAQLEAEMAADQLRAARTETLGEQRRVISRLASAPADTAGLVRLELDSEDAFALLGWLNRTYVAMRTTEVGTVTVGAEQSAAAFLGLDDPDEQETADVPFSALAGLFAMLASALVAELP